MTAEKVFNEVKNGNFEKLPDELKAINDVTKEIEVIKEALKLLENHLSTHKFEDEEEKHQFIQYIAILCSLNPYYEHISKKYFDRYVYMLINMEIPHLQINENTFFSFRSINTYSIEEIINNTISVSSPKTFNDPLDPPITLAARHKFKNISTLKNEQFFLESLEKVRIRCFVPEKHPMTKKELRPYLNTLMWSHYANSHKGICIKYKLSPSLIKKSNKITGIFAAVEYSENPFSLNSQDYFEFNECFLTKQIEWKYEHEVRLIYFNAENSDYYQPITLDENNRIEAIYFGCNCSESQKNAVTNLFLHNSNVKFYQMSINYNNIFQLEAKELSHIS